MSREIRAFTLKDLPEHLMNNRNRVNRKEALHYCPPSGGDWGVVRVACLVPEILVVFVIPMGCGRHGSIASFVNGTAGMVRYILVEEVDLVTGSHMEKTERALEEICREERPKGILLFTTCMDDLLGSDFDGLAVRMEERLGLPFARAKMNPMMSESKKPPELMIQKSIYDFLKPLEKSKTMINQIGNFTKIHAGSELYDFLKSGGITAINHVMDFCRFDDFLEMGRAGLNLLIRPLGRRACEAMANRLNQPYTEILAAFRPEGIEENYSRLREVGNFSYSLDEDRRALLDKIREASGRLRGKTAAVGGTINADAFELALFLTELGMEVRHMLVPVMKPHEEKYVRLLREKKPEIRVIPDMEPSLWRLSEPVDRVDYGIGIDTPVFFRVDKMVELPFEESLYGYRGSREFLDRLLGAEKFHRNIKEMIYEANLVI